MNKWYIKQVSTPIQNKVNIDYNIGDTNMKLNAKKPGNNKLIQT